MNNQISALQTNNLQANNVLKSDTLTNDPGIQATIQTKQMRQLFSASNISLVTSIILASILTYVQSDVISTRITYSWLALVVFFSLARAALLFAYFKNQTKETLPHFWLMRFRILVTIVGLLWGAACFVMFPAQHPQYQMFLIFILAGLSAGAVVSFSADLVTAITFLLLIIVPISIRLFIAGDRISIAMAVSILLYLGFMLRNMWHINLNTSQNIVLNVEAAAREEKVRTSEERYRLLLNHLPVGVFHFNAQYVITFCNELLAKFLHNTVDKIVGSNLSMMKDQSLLPALSKSLLGKVAHYEGQYTATLSDAKGWIYLICAPSLDASGKVVGGVAIVQDISARKLTEDKIEHLAFYDPLTQLPNRLLLLDRLKQALASSAHTN